ncbi:hypothetical protein GTY54_03730 [Streptomyces sp. SID625]|nr:hypothetical protein [Streptomyces sp. SID625]
MLIDAGGRVVYADEEPGDRDIDGILWERWGGTATGPSMWAEHHPLRQRHVMDHRPRCAMCGGEPDRDEQGVLWLLEADAAQQPLTFPLDIITTTPPVCREDGRRALRECPVLREEAIAVRVRDAELVGVRGTVYSRTAPPQAGQTVLFTDDAIHRVVASQLLRELRGAVRDDVTLAC